jgi:general secretion pathway protein A
MYERFYGVAELPFELTSNPKFLLLTSKHREVLSNIEHGIATRKGITLVIGEAGTGKTTLIRAAVRSNGQHVHYALLNNPTLTRDEFIEFLASAYELPPEAIKSKTMFLRELDRKLRENLSHGIISPLIVDEAQSLSYELLEEIRLLANMETDDAKLLPIALAAQPELASRLNENPLRQLKQRVCLRCDLAPLDIRETAAYISTRIKVAGGDPTQVFTREAVVAVHQFSRGIPRIISVVCDNAMMTGYAAGIRPITDRVIVEVSKDFDLVSAQHMKSTAATHAHVVPSRPPTPPSPPSNNTPAKRHGIVKGALAWLIP